MKLRNTKLVKRLGIGALAVTVLLGGTACTEKADPVPGVMQQIGEFRGARLPLHASEYVGDNGSGWNPWDDRHYTIEADCYVDGYVDMSKYEWDEDSRTVILPNAEISDVVIDHDSVVIRNGDRDFWAKYEDWRNDNPDPLKEAYNKIENRCKSLSKDSGLQGVAETRVRMWLLDQLNSHGQTGINVEFK